MAKLKQSACRLCLGLDELYPLFPDMKHCTSYKRALYLITGLKIGPSDGLPQKICRQCAKIVENGMNFRKRCRQIENSLLNKINILNKKSSKFLKESRLNIKEDNKLNIEEIKRETGKLSPMDIKNQSKQIQDGSDGPVNVTNNIISKDDIETYNNSGTDTKFDYESSVKNDESTEDEFENIERIKEISPSQHIFKPLDFKTACLELLEDPKNLEIRKCKICAKTYKSLNSFQCHARLHLGYSFMCEFCGYRCNNKPSLMRHLRGLHGAERDDKFPCSFCDYKALDKEQLEAHERRIHTKKRPHVCDQCGDAFFTRKVLLQHHFRHKPEKPFQCDICPSKFKRLGVLNLHKRRYHQRIYKYRQGCYMCEKTYLKCTSARKHLLKVHAIPREQQGKLLRVYNNDNLIGKNC